MGYDYSAIKGHIPDSVYDQLASIKEINGPKRLSNFLGECYHESGGFKKVTENLNYSGDALWKLFSRHFSSPEEAVSYQRQPEKIANRIYANRMGNGPESSGDGWRHRGAGYIQLTGKNNQQAFFRSIGLSVGSDPSIIATTYPLVSAAWFFTTNNLWTLCDAGIDKPSITALCKKINGGNLGIIERIQKTQEFYNLVTK